MTLSFSARGHSIIWILKEQFKVTLTLSQFSFSRVFLFALSVGERMNFRLVVNKPKRARNCLIYWSLILHTLDTLIHISICTYVYICMYCKNKEGEREEYTRSGCSSIICIYWKKWRLSGILIAFKQKQEWGRFSFHRHLRSLCVSFFPCHLHESRQYLRYSRIKKVYGGKKRD